MLIFKHYLKSLFKFFFQFIIRDSAASIAESVLVSTKLEPVIKIAAATKNSDGVADNVLALTKNKVTFINTYE